MLYLVVSLLSLRPLFGGLDMLELTIAISQSMAKKGCFRLAHTLKRAINVYIIIIIYQDGKVL